MKHYAHRIRILAIALLGLVPFDSTWSAATSAVISGPITITDRGLVRGIATETTFVFRGIPYAAPPVRELRWQPPQPAALWRGVRDATRNSKITAHSRLRRSELKARRKTACTSTFTRHSRISKTSFRYCDLSWCTSMEVASSWEKATTTIRLDS